MFVPGHVWGKSVFFGLCVTCELFDASHRRWECERRTIGIMQRSQQ